MPASNSSLRAAMTTLMHAARAAPMLGEPLVTSAHSVSYRAIRLWGGEEVEGDDLGQDIGGHLLRQVRRGRTKEGSGRSTTETNSQPSSLTSGSGPRADLGRALHDIAAFPHSRPCTHCGMRSETRHDSLADQTVLAAALPHRPAAAPDQAQPRQCVHARALVLDWHIPPPPPGSVRRGGCYRLG